ncbi:MAG: AsmA family protein, partial [Bacteroidales bacterium]
MKKLIKVILISIGVIIVLMIIMPLTMKSKIQQMVRLEAQELLNAEFNFDDISISLFRSFPDLSVSVQNVSVTGRTPFEGDTLLAAQHIYAAVNVLSLLGNDGFQISEVSLKKPLIQGIVDSKGRANWEIMKRSDSTAQSDILIEADETVVRLNLKRLHIENAEIRYRDSQAGTNLCLAGMNTVLSGNMDADQTLLKSKLSIADIRLMKANTTYLKQVSLEAEVDIDADLKHKKFTFHENNVSVNAIRTSLDGWVALQDTTGMDMDLQLNTSEVGFKEILSLIPAIYQHDFKDLQAEGRVGLSARAKGELRRGVLPAFETRLNIENGSFRYPSFAEGISDIQVDMAITSPGGSPDLIRADISRFHFLLSGNPFDLTARVTHFISDPEFALTAFGKMNLGKIREIYPLSDSVQLSGI